MNNFLPIKSNHRAAPLRLAARIISIMILAFLWPVRGGAQAQTKDLDVGDITGKLALTYKQKSNSQDYDWHYTVGGSNETVFTGTLKGTNNNWSHGTIDIKSEKEITDADKNLDSYPVLKLDGLNLTYKADGALFNMVKNGKPLCIQATGNSASTLNSKDTVINNDGGGILLLDGRDAELKIVGNESYGIFLRATGSNTAKAIFKGKINIKADNSYAVVIESGANISATEDARITVSAGLKAILDNFSNAKSPFLEWRFDSSAPESGKTLEIKDANGKSLDPAIQFTTDDKNKHFAVNAAKTTGYTLWLDGKQLMDTNEKTVFTATDDKLFSFSGMQTYPVKNWPDYAQTANVGTDGKDVAISDANYTVKTACGLAWIAWVTNNAKTKSGNTGETYTDYYPASAGFEGCTVTLAGNISLATPPDVASSFNKSWHPIGKSQKEFKGIFDGGGHTVSGLSITSFNETLYFGLFGYIVNAVVKNLRVAGEIKSEQAITRAGPFYFGGIAGYAGKSKIIACSNAVGIDVNTNSGWQLYIGGVAGVQDEGVINNCWNEAPLSGEITGGMYNIGGIVGKSQSGSISNCYSLGNVSGSGTNTADLPCAIGGIIGWLYDSVSLSNCYATGSVSAINTATGKSVWAGGIAGCYSYSNYADGTILQSTISNCLALNAGSESMISVTATGGTAHIGRILGESSSYCTISDCYASSKIKLKEGDNGAGAPTENIAHDKINGQSLFLDEVPDAIAAWAGPGDTKAFTAIGTDADGLLPQLKTIASFGNDHLPTQYSSSIIPDQPTASMKSTDYLVDPDPLSLPADNTETITLSCSDGKWSYQKGDNETSTRFSGTVKMAQDASTSTNKLIIDTATGNPTLTFEKVEIKPTDGVALTIQSGCELTIKTTGEGTSTLNSSAASTLVNKGSLTLTGKGLYIGNSGNNNEYYGLDNSGIFTVTHPSLTSVTFHCANTAIHNTGTLKNAWMEWRFADASGQFDGKIAFAATDDDNQSPAAQLRQGKTFATTVTAGKTYRLWTVTDSGGEVHTRQQGKTSAVPAVPVVYFQAPSENGVAVFTDVKDAVPVTVTQPTAGGGTISVFSGDSLLAKADTLPNGVKLTLKSYPLPGYELNAFVITPEVSNASNPTSEYTVPDDATTVTITVSFKAKTVAPADTTQADIVDKEENLPETPVEKPTAVIAKGNTTASDNIDSEVKLITGTLEDEHKKSVKDTLGKIAANISESNIIFAEIALVEITTTSGSGGAQMTTMTPIQPKDGHTVHVVYPYPSGTNNNDSFVIVHLKTDGTMEVYRDVPDTSKGEMKLDKTARGLEFDVDSFSPFGIAWTKAADPTPDPNPVPDPTPVYYTVTLPALEGATTDPVAGDYEVESWSSFRFYLTLDKDYDQSVPVVTTSRGETIEPRTSDGAYLVKYVRSAVTISIAGIQKNTDVANETIEAGVKVWTEPSALCLETDRTEEVRIVTVSGSTVAVFEAKPGLNRRALAPGLYIIQTPRKVCKVIVR